jgi:hypothetical protein
MKWFQDNPLGLTLAAISGVFALLVLGMAIIWSWPVKVETDAAQVQGSDTNGVALVAHEVAALSEFEVINDKPVFNESRQPIEEEVEIVEEVEEAVVVEAKPAPEVRLTGVIITADKKIASMTPTDTKQEGIMAQEGEKLTGEFVGWQVSTVTPRTVVLTSNDGQQLKLDLQVHDLKIQEPPKPVPVAPAKASEAEPELAENALEDDDEPLSRAEQIRQRIAERREELRRQQEAQQAQQAQKGEESQPQTRSRARSQDYKNAIRNQMIRSRKDTSSNEEKDG